MTMQATLLSRRHPFTGCNQLFYFGMRDRILACHLLKQRIASNCKQTDPFMLFLCYNTELPQPPSPRPQDRIPRQPRHRDCPEAGNELPASDSCCSIDSMRFTCKSILLCPSLAPRPLLQSSTSSTHVLVRPEAGNFVNSIAQPI